MKTRDVKAPASPKKLSKREKFISDIIFVCILSSFAIPGIYALTIGSINSNAGLTERIFMYGLGIFGMIAVIPLTFMIGYFGKPNNRNSIDLGKKDNLSWYQDPARSCMKGNYYHR